MLTSLVVDNSKRYPGNTSGLQFGYKRTCNSSTVMCTTKLLETIEYYVSDMSAVFVLYIDASKAVDRVYPSKLFNVLQAQVRICPLILRALFNMYTQSVMKLR